jgi:hypothetical protein
MLNLLRRSTPMQDKDAAPLLDRIATLASLQIGWDGYEAPVPSQGAIEAAFTVLKTNKLSMYPTHIDPLVDGGVDFSFLSKTTARESHMEFRNDGKVVGILLTGRKPEDTVQILEDLPTEDVLQKAIAFAKRDFPAE